MKVPMSNKLIPLHSCLLILNQFITLLFKSTNKALKAESAFVTRGCPSICTSVHYDFELTCIVMSAARKCVCLFVLTKNTMLHNSAYISVIGGPLGFCRAVS